MASIADLIKGLKKLDDQSFRPGDSLIASTINHPVDALSQLGKYLAKQTNTAAGIPDQYDNPNPLLAPSPDAQSQAAFDVAGMAQLGSMPFAPKSSGGTLGTFIGPKAATWDADKAAAAAKMLDDGVDPAQVWREHLIGRMPDGNLFSEIDDSVSRFNPAKWSVPYSDHPEFKKSSLGDVLSHDDLMSSYPDLSNVGVHLNNNMDMTAGTWHEAKPSIGLGDYMQLNYSPSDDIINSRQFLNRFNDPDSPYYFKNIVRDEVNNDGESVRESIRFWRGAENEAKNKILAAQSGMLPDKLKSTTLHELQHAIQQREGWARGGSPEQFKERLAGITKEANEIDAAQKAQMRISVLGETPEQAYAYLEQSLGIPSARIKYFSETYTKPELQTKWEQALESKKKNDPDSLYRRLAGEAQARATQDRLNMSMDERRANYPLAGGKLSDIPLEQLIYRYGDNGPAMAMDDNLNAGLLAKYLREGQLSPQELAQYETNAVQMTDSGKHHFNLANANAQGGTPESRAVDLGFDTPVYHGQTRQEDFWGKQPDILSSIDEESGNAELGRFFSTNSPFIAGKYAGDKRQSGAVYPLMLKSDEIYKADTNNWDAIKSRVVESGIRNADANNFNTALFENVQDSPSYNPISDFKSNVYASKGGLRSRFAAFDPLRKDSANLLATRLLPATMLGYGMYNENKKRSLADLLRAQ